MVLWSLAGALRERGGESSLRPQCRLLRVSCAVAEDKAEPQRHRKDAVLAIQLTSGTNWCLTGGCYHISLHPPGAALPEQQGHALGCLDSSVCQLVLQQ